MKTKKTFWNRYWKKHAHPFFAILMPASFLASVVIFLIEQNAD